MATFIQNGITFTASQGKIKLLGKISSGLNGSFTDAGTDGVEPFVNVVDIDWNGAVLPDGNIQTAGSVTINTTGEIFWNS